MTKVFWTDTLVRAVKTFAQTVLALMTTGSVGLTHVDWLTIFNVAGAAALASVLTSVTSLSKVGTASVGKHVDMGDPFVTAPALDMPVPDMPTPEATPTT